MPVTFAAAMAAKESLTPQIAARIEALEPQVVKDMREILLAAKNRADRGERAKDLLKQCCLPARQNCSATSSGTIEFASLFRMVRHSE
jgi:hypothetical protein